MAVIPKDDTILYLPEEEVRALCERVDVVAAVRDALALHGKGGAVLPDEAYLRWDVGTDEWARSLNMPGYLGGDFRAAGTKIINGNLWNRRRGIARASGLTLLFDPVTGRISCVMAAADISALRTAAVTALSADLFAGPPVHRLALIGAGTLADSHLRLLPAGLPALRRVAVHDVDRDQAHRLVSAHRPALAARGVEPTVVDSAEEAVCGSQLVVPVTTTTEGYIRRDWLAPGALLVNVSLDDALPDVLLHCDRLFVDDWHLVATDDKRLLGRLVRDGLVTPPPGIPRRDGRTRPEARAVDAELGQVVNGQAPARRSDEEVIVVNPFGMSIEDIAVAARIHQAAVAAGLGQRLPR
ncbi:ornithine cyclodeaminase family protein [Streptomyces sp. URMC 129]|uniref:ornithine cyclodeaminase family protein n=1 Tax=Streptomyces sp. URMC 129 TaxID=3423407 RepID=UPI003F1D209E